MGIKYPDIKIQLTGGDGNAFFILGRCERAARKAKLPAKEIQLFREEATSGDYDHLLQTCIKWFNIS